MCAVLEQRGLRCWVAPRDIPPGVEWAEAILGGIEASRIMVLVFSNHANESPQVRREVERAVSKGLVIIPLRLEDVVPTKALEYFISATHWLDAFTPPFQRHLETLAETILGILGLPQNKVIVSAPAQPIQLVQTRPNILLDDKSLTEAAARAFAKGVREAIRRAGGQDPTQ